MIIKNVNYRGQNLWNNNQWNILLEWVSKNANLRTDYFTNENNHGSRSWYTLGDGRLFSFNWIIHGATGEDRQWWVDLLNDIIRPEWLPTATKDWFYDLFFEDFKWNKFKTRAKVVRQCNFDHSPDDPFIRFDFALWSDNYEYFWFSDKWYYKEISWTIDPNYWVSLPVVFPFNFWPYETWISVVNNWNFIARCSVSILWDLENPKITNLTNWTFYWLNYTTKDLTIDNRGKKLIITDDGLDVSKYRTTWSTSLYLSPWNNELIITTDSITIDLKLNILYNDTFCWS